MPTPLGNNPIGEHAASEARHDKPLPGHVPGLPSMQIGDVAAPTPSTGGFNTAYAGPGVPMRMAKPIAWFFFYSWMYLTAPVEAALYPIAGAAGVVGAALGYLLARAVGGGHDTTQEWAWTGCFFGVIALMRAETRYEAGHSSYRSLRHALRLVFGFLFMTYFGIHSQGDSFGTAVVVGAAFAVILHFVLRSQWLRFAWHSMQFISGMRVTM